MLHSYRWFCMQLNNPMVVQVKTNAANNVCGHTFYVMDASGAAPERAAVERACQQVILQKSSPMFKLHRPRATMKWSNQKLPMDLWKHSGKSETGGGLSRMACMLTVLCCAQLGGHLAESGEDAAATGVAPISFSLPGQQWRSNWSGTAASPDSTGFSSST